MTKQQHKFFERFLDNDLNSLYNFLDNLHKQILNGEIESIPKKLLPQHSEHTGAPTQLGSFYNIFDFDHPGIKQLKISISEMIKEACEYYEIDYSSNNWGIHGWFNSDRKQLFGEGVNPVKYAKNYHDHMEGQGAPYFHGYYCVEAEPSITFYKINREIDYENINKNNRAIVSETGHPHGRDDWFGEKNRITIAYDILPSKPEAKYDPFWQYLDE